jgi:ABC-type nitrate/sulfonate/bicarbonate transport system substrate-binding protein
MTGRSYMVRRLAILLLVGLSGSVASAQEPTRIVAGYSAISGHHSILWIAHEAGLFEKNGLKVEMVLIRSGTTHAQALVAGGTQISQLAGTSGLAAGVAGADIAFVSMYLNTAPFIIYGNVSKIADLKGKAIGVTRYGSTTDISARFALRKFGLQPEKDVALVQLEDYPGILGGIKSGRIAAGVFAPPFTDHAQGLGYKAIVNVAELGLEFPFAGLAAKKTYLREHADIVQRFLRAHIEALAVFKNNRDLTMKILKKYTGIEDPAVLASTVDFYAPKFPRAPYPTADGIRLALEQIALTDPRAKSAKPEEFMDIRFVKQLDENGFIKSLYPGR